MTNNSWCVACSGLKNSAAPATAGPSSPSAGTSARTPSPATHRRLSSTTPRSPAAAATPWSVGLAPSSLQPPASTASPTTASPTMHALAVTSPAPMTSETIVHRGGGGSGGALRHRRFVEKSVGSNDGVGRDGAGRRAAVGLHVVGERRLETVSEDQQVPPLVCRKLV